MSSSPKDEGQSKRKRPDKSADRRALLEGVIRLLLEDGTDPNIIDEIVLAETRKARKRRPVVAGDFDSMHWAYLADISHVLTHWHNDPRYLDGRDPRPLSHEEFVELVRKVLPNDDPEHVISSLLRHRGLCKVRTESGAEHYVTDDRVRRTRGDEVARAHNLYGLLAHVRTVEAVMHHPDPPFQLHATNPYFPVALLGQGRDMFRERGRVFLRELDNYAYSVELPPNSAEPSARIMIAVITAAELNVPTPAEPPPAPLLAQSPDSTD